MERDFRGLGRGPFDLLVIGGGIYGSWVAYDAALRGLRVALVERHDWAAGTSSASSKLIHGGLRYLEQWRFGLVRKALDERGRLARLAPHRVRPLQFLLPNYAGARPGRAKLKLGLWLYDRIAGRGQPVAGHSSIDAASLLGRVDLRPEGLLGALTFGDCATDDARFTLEIVDGALGAGALAVNRARVVSLLTRGTRVTGAAVECRETGEALEVQAALTTVCAGPWTAGLVPETASAIRLTKGVHLVLPSLGAEQALLLGPGPDGRIVFLIPWYGRTLVGTTDTDFQGDPDRVRVEPQDLDYLLERANRVLRSGWSRTDVIASFAGLRSLPATRDATPSSVTREWKLLRPREGLLVPLGGKYTSARADAAEVVDAVLETLGRPRSACPTADRPLPWCPPAPYAQWKAVTLQRGVELGLDPETAANCAERFGSRIDRLHRRLADAPALARRAAPGAPFCLAEIVQAAESEMALTLADVLRRRVPLLLVDPPGRPLLVEAARLAGDVHGWSAERRAQETDEIAGASVPAGSPR